MNPKIMVSINKSLSALLVILLIGGMLSGCQSGRTVGESILPEQEAGLLERVNNADSYQTLVTETIDIRDFVRTFDPQMNNLPSGQPPRLYEIASAFGLPCLRRTEKQNGDNTFVTLYSVYRTKPAGLLYVFYMTNAGEIAMRSWYYVRKSLRYADFQEIGKGDDIRQVEKIDPATSVYIRQLKEYSGDPDEITESRHYLEDGILIFFYEYRDGQYVVCDSSFSPDYTKLTGWTSGREPLIYAEVLPMDRL